VLAGGVYLSAGTAEASNMGFKLERSFSWTMGQKNLYLVSFPLFNGLGDVSDNNTCSGSDGIINASDALCDLATDRDLATAPQPLMVFQRLNESTCIFEGRTLLKVGPATYSFVGSFQSELTSPENREVGFIINVNAKSTDPAPENRAVIVGSHDPSWAGKMITRVCPKSYLNLPYHTMYRTADEILCGLAGFDWVDEVNNGSGDPTPDTQPDTCPNGLFDPGTGLPVVAQTFDGTRFVGRTVFGPPGAGTPQAVGNNFDLTPGDAYLFNMPVGYPGRLWLPPHF
jgi:hypothetical protein